MISSFVTPIYHLRYGKFVQASPGLLDCIDDGPIGLEGIEGRHGILVASGSCQLLASVSSTRVYLTYTIIALHGRGLARYAAELPQVPLPFAYWYDEAPCRYSYAGGASNQSLHFHEFGASRLYHDCDDFDGYAIRAWEQEE